MGNQQSTPATSITPQPPTKKTPFLDPFQPQTQKQPTHKPKQLLPLKSPPHQDPFKLKRATSALNYTSQQSFGRSRLKRKGSSQQNIQLPEQPQQQSILSPEQIDTLFFNSEYNRDKFFDNLQEPLSTLYMDLSKTVLSFMNNKYFLSHKEAKLHLSEKMLTVNLNILKAVVKQEKYQFDQETFIKYNQLQKSIVGYLKAKYPRGTQNFVSGDLMNVFKSFDYVQSPENDIIRQAGFYFRKQNTRELLTMIKQFLNKVIDEIDSNFPRFQKLLQDKIFKTKLNEDRSLSYKISRKLPQNIQKFTNITSNSLDIVSPQLFQVILKWTNDMECFLLDPQSEVQEKETFKIVHQEDQQKYYVDQINTDDNEITMKWVKERLKQQKQIYTKDVNELILSMYEFQHNLIKIIQQGQLSERYVPLRDAEIIKFAAYNTKFKSWMLAQKLTIVLKKLIKVGRELKNTIFMAPLDLVKFNVLDLLTSSIMGTKKQILQVYSNLKQLQSEEQIKIIRLQNRLMTSLNDIIILFKIKDSFLICQLQLILADPSQSSNEKLKNIQILHQFFDNLKSSPYGAISELAQFVGYEDSKVGYENKITFSNKEIGIPMCEKRHLAKISSTKEQFEPFICTTCSKYYGRLQNLFIMKQCKQCNNYLCSKCIFKSNNSLEESYLKDQIIKFINQSIAIAIESTRGKTEGAISGLTGKMVYEKMFQKFVYIKDINKELKIKKMTITQFQSYFKSLGKSYFVYGSYQKSQIKLIPCKYNILLNELSFTLSSEDFYKSKSISFKDGNFILFYTQQKPKETNNSQLQKVSYMNFFDDERKLQKGMYQTYKVGDTEMIVGFNEQENEDNVVDAEDFVKQQQGSKKQFKLDSLKTFLEIQGFGQRTLKSFKLQDLGIEQSHLNYFKSLAWANQITQLNLSKNKIRDIKQLLKIVPNLQKLSVSQNYLKSIDFPIKLNNLSSLVARRNIIKSISNIQNIPNIERINFQENMIQVFPILKHQKLRYLNVAQNYLLTSLKFIEESLCPQLSYINLEYSNQNLQYVGQLKQRRLKVLFPKLKCFLTYCLDINSIIFKSDILERLSLESSSLVQINGRFPKLQYFNAKRCKLTSLDLLFSGNCQNNCIIDIDLEANQISQLPKTFKSNSLKKLQLSSNQLENVDALYSSELPNLQMLNISYNQIKKLQKLDFKSLKTFNMYGNPFVDVEELAKSNMPLIQNLEFSADTPFKKWPKFVFPKLQTLNLPAVEYPDSLEQFQKSELQQLVYLTVSSVKLKEFPKINFPKLQQLRIVYSTINRLDTISQSIMPQLKKIDINCLNQQNQPLKQDNQSPQAAITNQNAQFRIDLPQNLPKLQQLNITVAQFNNYEPILLKSYPNLSYLYMSSNNLKNVPKMSMVNLKYLNFSNNQIQDISLFCLSDLPKLETIDLSSNKLTSIGQMKFKELQTLTLTSNELTKIKNLDLPNLLKLAFDNNKLEEFPLIFALKLTQIEFTGNPFKNIKQLQKTDFPSLKNLRLYELNLQQDESTLPKLQMPNIQVLDVYSSNFTSIDNINLFSKLTGISLSYCTNIKDFPKLNLPELKTMGISNCTFESWSGLQQSSFENLNSLTISWSNIQKLGKIKCPNLTDISIYDNEKLHSCEQFFSINKFSQLLNLNFRGDNNLVINTELNLPLLQRLDFTFIQFQSLKLIGTCDKLVDISIAEGTFPDLNLRQIKKLQALNLLTCKIQNIQSFCKKDWRSIKTINLSQNKIKKIPKFTRFPQLQNLYLSQNQIEDVQEFLQKSSLPSLTYLTLSTNKIKKIKGVKNMPKLMFLILQQNQIEDISFLNHFENVFSFLHTINLDHNVISKIPQSLKVNSQYLYLKKNKIESIEFLNKSEMPRLHTIELNDNLIKKLTPINKLSKLSSINLYQNPIQNYDEFMTKKMFPNSIQVISMSVQDQAQKIDQNLVKYQKLYPQLSLGFAKFEEVIPEPIEPIQQNVNPVERQDNLQL